MFSSNSSYALNDSVNLHKGLNHIDVVYDGLPVSPGKYRMNVRIWDENQEDLDWVENALEFEVVESDLYGTGRFYKGGADIVVLPHTWSIE